MNRQEAGPDLPQRPRVDLCLASLRFHPEYSGPAVRFKRYAGGLRRRGVEMRVLTANWVSASAGPESPESGGNSQTTQPSELDTVEGIHIRRFKLEAVGRRRMNWEFSRALARNLRRETRPEVLQLLDVSPWSVPWLYRLRRLGVPIVYTQTMVRDPATPANALRRWRQGLPFRLLDCVVVSTTIMREALREEGVKVRVEVIPNGLDLARFRPLTVASERMGLRSELGLDPDAELVLFVGGFLEERKGIDVLANAWQSVAHDRPKARLVLVGPNFDRFKSGRSQREFFEGVEASLEASGARDRVVFTGPVQNVEHYLQVADLFVFPSRREGMPNVVPEAFGCGVPTVLTPFIGLPTEFGRPGTEYELCERTPRALAESISRLLQDRPKREVLAKAARAWVERELDLECSLDKYAALYWEFADQHRNPRGQLSHQGDQGA